MTTINGDLHGVHYEYTSNTFGLVPQTYSYELTASGGGRVAMKIEYEELPELGEVGVAAHWVTLEDKSKIQSGTSLNGKFTAPKSSYPLANIRFKFSREVLSDGVDFKLTFEPA